MSINPNVKYDPSGNIGIEYAITSPLTGIKHAVMGTSHVADAESLQNLCLDRILKCSELFTEMGTKFPLPSSDGCFPGVEIHNISYPYSVDGFLTIMAGWRKIPITSLDDRVPELQDEFRKQEIRLEEMGAEAFGNDWDDCRYKEQASCSLEEMEHFSQGVQDWKEGNLDKINERSCKSDWRTNTIYQK